MELKQLLWILNGANVHPIEAFFTYFPYGRQDNVFQIGETNVAENLIRELIEYYHVSRIYTIDAHFFGKRDWTNKYPITDISAIDLLKQAASKDYQNIIYLAPDAGSQLRTGLKGTEKNRKDSYAVEVQSDEYFRKTVKNQTIGAIDDLLLTGGTLDRFHDECMKYGAKEVIALITHGVLRMV